MNAVLQQIKKSRLVQVDESTQKHFSLVGEDFVVQTDEGGGVAGEVWFAVGRLSLLVAC
jgi:hypothetical protein